MHHSEFYLEPYFFFIPITKSGAHQSEIEQYRVVNQPAPEQHSMCHLQDFHDSTYSQPTPPCSQISGVKQLQIPISKYLNVKIRNLKKYTCCHRLNFVKTMMSVFRLLKVGTVALKKTPPSGNRKKWPQGAFDEFAGFYRLNAKKQAGRTRLFFCIQAVFEKRAYRTRSFSTKRFLKEERVEHIFFQALVISSSLMQHHHWKQTII